MNTHPTAVKLDSFSFVAKKKAEGKIKHIGFSFHASPELLEEMCIRDRDSWNGKIQPCFSVWNPGKNTGRQEPVQSLPLRRHCPVQNCRAVKFPPKWKKDVYKRQGFDCRWGKPAC